MRLNIGCGSDEYAQQLEGWERVDRQFGNEAYPLAYPDNSADEIRASHILEHFPYTQVGAVLADWYRVLKPGGKIKVAVPNFGWIAHQYQNGSEFPLEKYVLGSQMDPDDFHKSLFDERGLRFQLQKAGFVCIRPWESEIKDCAALDVSLNLEAVKPTQAVDSGPLNASVAAVMSMPRLAFTDNMFVAVKACVELQIDLSCSQGAFWSQCLHRALKTAIAKQPDYILTIDYDTVFDADTVRRLVMLMEAHPEVDALAPMQAKREADHCLMFRGEATTLAHFDGEVAEVDTAHFGLTLIRRSSLESMPLPWFGQIPDEKDGTAGDDDIFFWRKFREHGRRVFMASHVSVGHLQMMASWPAADLGVIHQYVSDYNKTGAPSGIRG